MGVNRVTITTDDGEEIVLEGDDITTNDVLKTVTPSAGTTQTLEDTQANEQLPVLVLRFAGCDRPLFCELHELGPGSILWETFEIALDDLPRGHIKRDENGEAPIVTITAVMVDRQQFENLDEWYC